MALNVIELPDRQTIAADPEADFQPWTGIAADGNALRFNRMRSANRRSWCALDSADQLRRLTQGLSFNGHFPTPGEALISTNQVPGLSLRLVFDHPIRGIGVDVEPAPDVMVPGQAFKVRLELAETATAQSAIVEKTGQVGACSFLGARCDADKIDQVKLRVAMLDDAGQETPVDFAINRLELLTPVGSIV